jgi:hypothetical protein
MTRLVLSIDELVLDGFDPRDRHRIADAVRHELTHLVRLAPVAGPADQSQSSPIGADVGSPRAVARDVRRSISAAIAERGFR